MKALSLKRENTITFFLTAGLTAMLIIGMLPSCKNDVQTVLSLDVVDTLPEITARDVEILYSEKARVQIRLESPYLVNETQENEPVILFPEGFTVYFYDSAMNLQSKITADYGISYEKKKLMEARHNVVVENLQKNEMLNTEELFWDRAGQKIYSNKFVRLTTEGQVVTGDGLTSAEPFDEVFINNTKGLLEIKEETGDD